ncbi:hypothetical protein EYF80_000414 [Liparis tanakae]|uniref:Uncharacterized protein n=1 Tax=Liparis tanakae TaxID=230148 RepID=A0A4Z2JFU5_9TELE|nr:hypothetical protein EYF80_000414 [Liparis tanakae]
MAIYRCMLRRQAPQSQVLRKSALLRRARRQRATAGEELGFKQYRLQEAQPSLLVEDSDINTLLVYYSYYDI